MVGWLAWFVWVVGWLAGWLGLVTLVGWLAGFVLDLISMAGWLPGLVWLVWFAACFCLSWLDWFGGLHLVGGGWLGLDDFVD